MKEIRFWTRRESEYGDSWVYKISGNCDQTDLLQTVGVLLLIITQEYDRQIDDVLGQLAKTLYEGSSIEKL